MIEDHLFFLGLMRRSWFQVRKVVVVTMSY